MKKKNIFTLVLMVVISFFLVRTVNAQNVGLTDGSSFTPQSLLHVHQNAATGTLFQLTNTTSTNASQKGFLVNIASDFDIEFKNMNGHANSGFSFWTTPTAGPTTEKVTILDIGNVGIGTTAPAATLEVNGSAIFNEAGADKDFRVEGNGNPNMIFVDASLNQIGLLTNTFPTNHSVEIGAAGTASSLEIRPQTWDAGSTATVSIGDDYNYLLGSWGSGLGLYMGSSENLRFFTDASGGGFNGTERMTILRSSGNVGIGSNTPSQKLDVAGMGRFNTDDVGTAAIQQLAENSAFIGQRGGEGGALSLNTSFVGAPGWTVGNFVIQNYCGSLRFLVTSPADGTTGLAAYMFNDTYFSPGWGWAHPALGGTGDHLWGNVFTKGNINIYNSGETHYNAIQTQASQAVDITYNLPTTQGAASTYLQNDGSGNLTWAAGGGGVGGSGTANYVAKFSAATTLANSLLTDDGTNVSVGTTTGTVTIGAATQTGAISVGTSTGALTLNLGTGASGIKTINIGTGATANPIIMGTFTASSTTRIRGARVYIGDAADGDILDASGGSLYLKCDATHQIHLQAPNATDVMTLDGATGAIVIGAPAGTGAMSLGVSTGAVTLNLGTGASGIKTVNIATTDAANVVTIGDNTGAAVSGTVRIAGANITANGPVNYGVTGGAAQVQTLALSPALTALVAGQTVTFKAGFANTGAAPTLNVNGLGAKSIIKRQATALVAGDIALNGFYMVIYNGTSWVLLNPTVTP